MQQLVAVRASVIVPIHQPHGLERVLAPLAELGEDWDVVLVGDGDLPWLADVAARCLPRARLLFAPSGSGPSGTRNCGAFGSSAPILVFLDSDVEVRAATLLAMVAYLEGSPEKTGVFGSYTVDGFAGESPLSRFRNLLHHYVHHQCAGQAQSFWTGLGCLRREAFMAAQGFCTKINGIEDVELGKRLADAGGSLWLEPAFQGRHLKHWTWTSFVRTDIFLRAAPWAYLGWSGRATLGGLNAGGRFRLAPPVLALALLFRHPLLFLGYLALNLPIYRCMARHGGLGLGLRSVVYLAAHHVCCLVGGVLGTWQYALERLRQRGEAPPSGPAR